MEERILEVFRVRKKDVLFADAIADIILNEDYEGDIERASEAVSGGKTGESDIGGAAREDRFSEEIVSAIKHLTGSGRLMMSKSGRVGLPEAFGFVLGTILINDKGYGFFRPTGGGSDRKLDVFVRKSEMKGALHRDTVLVRMRRTSRGDAAEIDRIVRRATEVFVGTFEGSEVIPNDRKVYRSLLAVENPAGAKPGDVVAARVISWNNDRRPIRCRITEVLGKPGDRGIDILAVAKQFELEADFPREVLDEAEKLSREMPLGRRADFRHLPTVTIDGADAKDIDDAISLEIFGNSYSGNPLCGSLMFGNSSCADADAGVSCADGICGSRMHESSDCKSDAGTCGARNDGAGNAHGVKRDESNAPEGGLAYRLYVHIADVSHYVRPGTELDREARKRGTSVYLLDRVIPMLPKRLSNDLCSLNAGEDRYALTCVLDYGRDGRLIGHDIVKSLIRVDARLDYESVSRQLEAWRGGEGSRCAVESCDAPTDSESRKGCEHGVERGVEHIGEQTSDGAVQWSDFMPMLAAMANLSARMRQARSDRGAVDFDFPEPQIHLDERGVPTEIVRRERDIASLIIEDFMLAANEAIAEHFYWLEIPFVYRVHEAPSPDKIEDLRRYVRNFGLVLKGRDDSAGISKLIREIRGTPYETAVAREALRSMMQARYCEENLGHFGLKAKYYCHFTAPIRRYPDLFVHRIIGDHLAGSGRADEDAEVSASRISLDACAEAAELSGICEQNAESAERKVVAMKMAEYMESHIGEEFEGMISSVMSYGIFVQLDNLVEGLVHVTLMPDDEYEFDEERRTLTGIFSGEVFAVGDRVEVLVASSNRLTGKVDFSLIAEVPTARRGRGVRPAHGGGFRAGRDGKERETDSVARPSRRQKSKTRRNAPTTPKKATKKPKHGEKKAKHGGTKRKKGR